MAYRPAHGIANTARYGGMGNRPPDPHSIIDMHAGSEESQRRHGFAHLQALFQDAVKDEEDAIKKYTCLLEELNKYIGAFGTVKSREYSDVEIIEHIRAQEFHHKALLEKLLQRKMRALHD